MLVAYVETESVSSDPFTTELVKAILQRAAQGMTDAEIGSYLDYRKRGLPVGGEEYAVIEEMKRALGTEGSYLFDEVTAIREADQRAEAERLRKARKKAKTLPLMPGVSDEVYRLWRMEQRYKNSLIPPGARGGGKSGRRRKKEARRSRGDATPLETVIAKHNAYLDRKRRLGIPV